MDCHPYDCYDHPDIEESNERIEEQVVCGEVGEEVPWNETNDEWKIDEEEQYCNYHYSHEVTVSWEKDDHHLLALQSQNKQTDIQ